MMLCQWKLANYILTTRGVSTGSLLAEGECARILVILQETSENRRSCERRPLRNLLVSALSRHSP